MRKSVSVFDVPTLRKVRFEGREYVDVAPERGMLGYYGSLWEMWNGCDEG
jgi:hypothetical protein